MHHAANLTLGFALGYGLAARFGDARWAIAGFAIGAGLGRPELAQRLPLQGVLPAVEKRDGKLSGRRRSGRPAAAAGSLAAARPGRLDLAGFQGVRDPRRHCRDLPDWRSLAIASPRRGSLLWQTLVSVMAVLAPALAIGRTARSVSGRAAESEFARWFQPLGEIEEPAQPHRTPPPGHGRSPRTNFSVFAASISTCDDRHDQMRRRGQDAHAAAWVCLR